MFHLLYSFIFEYSVPGLAGCREREKREEVVSLSRATAVFSLKMFGKMPLALFMIFLVVLGDHPAKVLVLTRFQTESQVMGSQLNTVAK